MAPPRRPEIVIGLDVGKSSHWACVATRDGEVLASKPIANRENALDSLFAEFPGALVVVDQVRNIGALALSRARAAGMPSAYLPGLAAHEAARLFGGDAKTDERDAMVIAKTALGIPDALHFAIRIAGRPVRRLRTAAHGRPRRAVVGGRRRAPKGGGPRPRRAARQGGRASSGPWGRLPGRTRPRSPPRTAR